MASYRIPAQNAGAQPWRFDASDDLTAVDTTSAALPVFGRAVATPWDLDLARRMSHAGVAVHDEALGPVLLADLR